MPGPMSESVEQAVKAATWLKPTDRAAVDLALVYAKRIDDALEFGDGYEQNKALYLGPHLLNTLRALGCTPAERKALDVGGEVKSKLAELRALRPSG